MYVRLTTYALTVSVTTLHPRALAWLGDGWMGVGGVGGGRTGEGRGGGTTGVGAGGGRAGGERILAPGPDLAIGVRGGGGVGSESGTTLLITLERTESRETQMEELHNAWFSYNAGCWVYRSDCKNIESIEMMSCYFSISNFCFIILSIFCTIFCC